MNNIKQALESAIEFIEGTASFIPVDYDHIGIDVVTQCKSALAELDKCEPVALERDYNFMRDLAIGCEDAWNKLQEQEPVGWMLFNTQGNSEYVPNDNNKFFTLQTAAKQKPIPLYTNAPTIQREGWVSVPIEPTKEMQEALFKTPAQSLQAHDNEVIERCAKVCDEHGAIWVAKSIRALKT